MLSRLVGIIYIILSKGTVTAEELAKQFEVSVRTIYRDIERLSMAGIPIYARKGKNGGISLTERFVLDKMVISTEEQRRILAALASLRETGATEEEEILQKLGAFFKADAPDWVAIDFSDWSGRRQELFERIRKAILERRVLEFDYYGQYGEMSHRTVEPVQLLFKEYTWYVRAYCRKRRAMRLFKVLRMKRVEVLEEIFEPGSRIWAEETVGAEQEAAGSSNGQAEPGEAGSNGGQADSGKECETFGWEQRREEKVVFQIAAREAYRIYDRFEEEEIERLPDGDFLITLQCCLDDWVYGVILSFGPSARVIAPEYVREKMVEKIRDMEKNYL